MKLARLFVLRTIFPCANPAAPAPETGSLIASAMPTVLLDGDTQEAQTLVAATNLPIETDAAGSSVTGSGVPLKVVPSTSGNVTVTASRWCR